MRRWISLLLLLAGTGTTAAQAPAWAPPEPQPEARDWIKLNSGEWLRGTIELMRDQVLEFDSMELDDQKIDWGDIAEIRSPRLLSYAFLDGSVATGTSRLQNGLVQISSFGSVFEFPADSVHAIIEGPLTERNYWSTLASMNLIIRQGNTDQSDYHSHLHVRRETTASRLNFIYKGNYGRVDGNQTVNNHRVNLDYNLYLSRRFFATPVRSEIFTDRYQNIDLRTNLSAGVGYYLLRGKNDWYISASGGYQRTRYVSVQPDQAGQVDNGILTWESRLEMDLTRNVDLVANYSLKATLGRDNTLLHNLFLQLSFDLLGDWLDFNASLNWERNRNPKTNAEGFTPKRDDLVMTYGLEMEF